MGSHHKPKPNRQQSITNGHLRKVRVHTKLNLVSPSLLKRPDKASSNFNSQCDTLPNWMPPKQTDRFNRFNSLQIQISDRFSDILQTMTSPSLSVSATVALATLSPDFNHSGCLLLFFGNNQQTSFVCPDFPQCSHLTDFFLGHSLALCPSFPQMFHFHLETHYG
jgi:hypothetical protein